MRILEAGGAAYELGRAIGEQADDLVRNAVDLICRFELPQAEVAAHLRGVERRLAETFPETLEEARGVADGAGVGADEVLALSVCSDLSGKLPAWCSLVAVPGAGGTLVGKNLDTTPEMAALQVIERLRPAGKLAFVHVTTAGAMWTDGGVNSAGLALVNASLAAGEADPMGVPDGILARELLARCATVADAVELAGHFSARTLGENMLVADAGGGIAVIEKLPGGQAVREGPTAAACNHVLSSELAEGMAADDPVKDNSRRRFSRLERAIGVARAWRRDDVHALLSDPEGGVFQQGDSGLHTIASLVLVPAERRAWIGPSGAAPAEVSVQGEGNGPGAGRREEVQDGIVR
jgi:isopenicillin-N N-acyltransferase-like protein